MSSPFVAEIKIFAGDFAPRGYALCNGQILPISQNTALFALLGTRYGGNGASTFGLPDLQGSAPLHQGSGAGLSPRFVGESGGSETVSLLTSEMPIHTHQALGVASTGGTTSPSGASWAQIGAGRTPPALYSSTAPNTQMSPLALTTAGSGQPHNNMHPYLALTFIIALQGIYPARN